MLLEAAASVQSVKRTNFPSGISVSADGQILVLTHSTLHILTPSITLGKQGDRSALSGYPGNKSADQWRLGRSQAVFEGVKVSSHASNVNHASVADDERDPDVLNAMLTEHLQECMGFEMFKNGIEVKVRDVEWEDWTNDERLTVSGGLDNGWRMASWSPSGLSELGGCVLATLNANQEVVVYRPGGDSIKSTWTASFDLTNALIEMLCNENEDLVNKRSMHLSHEQRRRRELLTMRAQATGVSWSPATPAHAIKDESVLAVGHRSGEVSFWRYLEDGSMRIMKMVLVLNVWPLTMAWSIWHSRLDSFGQVVYSAQMAVTGTSGDVQVLRVSILPDASIEVTQEQTLTGSKKPVTFMRWLDPSRLLLARFGEVSVWSPDVNADEGVRRWELPMDTFRGWPSMPSPVAVNYMDEGDSLQIALNDGTFRFITKFSTPHAAVQGLGGDSSSQNRSLHLSEEAKRLLLATEKTSELKQSTNPSPHMTMVLGGFGSIVHEGKPATQSGLFVWLYEKEHLDIRTYAMAGLHKSTVLIANVYDSGLAGRVLRELADLLRDPPAAAMESSSGSLLSILVPLRHYHDSESFSRALMRVLEGSLDLNVNTADSATSKDEISNFLLTDKKVQGARLAGLVAKYWVTNCQSDVARETFQSLHDKIALYLYYLVFSALLRVLEFGQANSETLRTRFQQIVASVRQRQEDAATSMETGPSGPPESFDSELDERDSCAACGEVVPFGQLGRANCRNGHAWLRCSITLDVLSTASTRTCMVCHRKTKVPPAVLSPDASEAQRAEHVLLTMSKCCLFCSGRWTRGH